MSLLFKSCAQPSLQHLLSSDIYYNYDPITDQDPHTWQSPFITAITHANTKLLQFLGDTAQLPPSATTIAHHPVAAGGLGFRNPAHTAKTAFVVSLTRSIRYATHGIATKGNTIALAPDQARPLASWNNPHTTQPLFLLFQRLAPPVIQAHTTARPNHPQLNTPTDLVMSADLQGLAPALYHQDSARRMQAFQATAPPHVALALPALLTHLTSLPLCSYNRRFPHNRLDNEVFTVMLQRKLRLPVIPPILAQQPCHHCHHPLDIYGDHLFRCYYSKKVLSDNIRDTLYTICTNLAPLAGLVHSHHSVSCETGGLLPTHPTKRPADVGLALKPSARPHGTLHPPQLPCH